jgi:predicted amidohydrolase
MNDASDGSEERGLQSSPLEADRRDALKLIAAGVAGGFAGALSGGPANASAPKTPAASPPRTDSRGTTMTEAKAPSAIDHVAEGYWACALQSLNDCVHPDATREAARERVKRSLARIDVEMAGAKRWIGADLKLIVLPEYVLTGPPWGEPIPVWADKAAFDMDGAEYEALAALAEKHAVFLSVNAYETDRHFPGLYFQACVCFDPAGNVVLRYRRLISMFAPSPHDVWDKYLDVYGAEAVFPVARTAIGNLAAIASEEILYPEIARCHAIRGAEVFMHNTSEAYTVTMPQKRIARLARAMENMAYVVSANTAGSIGIEVPVDSSNGGSEIVDYYGNVVVQAGVGSTMTANARLDVGDVRRYRRRPGMSNMLSRQALDLYVDSFAEAGIRRRNGLLKDGKIVVPERSYFVEKQREALGRMAERGVVPK